MPTTKYIKAKPGPHHSVIYIDENGRCERYEQGSWAWRNHNPGNLVSGDTSKRYGQIGKAGGFAVFPDTESGHQALLYCLSNVYKNKSIDDMVKNYAPKETNNTEAYRKFLYQKTEVTKGKKIKDFTPEEFKKLWQAIESMEGTKAGIITPLQAITWVRKDTSQAISEYCIDGVKWASKAECLELASQGKLDVAVCSSRLGNRYVRARVNSPIQRDLAKIVEK